MTNMISKLFFKILSLKIPAGFVTHHGKIWSHSVPVNPEGQEHEKRPLIMKQLAAFLQGLEAQSTFSPHTLPAYCSGHKHLKVSRS